MEGTLITDRSQGEQDRRISEAIDREQSRLRAFIRRRVSNQRDIEDILQDVFFELVAAYRLMKPVDHVGAWLFRVARNRIIDIFRKEQREADEGPEMLFEDLLPSPDASPEAAYARTVLFEELEEAINELPADQREVFIAHEIDGVSYKEIASASGVNVNTLLSRKHYAVLYLRRRLQAIRDEFLEGQGPV